jgi:hypothetical protein
MKNQDPTAAKPGKARFYFLPLVLMAITSVGCATRSNRSVEAIGENRTFATNPKTFGTAGKEGVLYPDHEVVLFQHEGPGCLTHMWFGGDWPGYERTEIRFYVDGEVTPSIDMELFRSLGPLGHRTPRQDRSTKRTVQHLPNPLRQEHPGYR